MGVAAVVGVAASRALGEGTNALPEARAIAKIIIRMQHLEGDRGGRPLVGTRPAARDAQIDENYRQTENSSLGRIDR